MAASLIAETESITLDDVSELDTDSNLEVEQDDIQTGVIKHPFNPERIKIRTVNIVAEQLVSRIGHDEIDLAPDFQRLKVWDHKGKSRLIESLLLRIPIPLFYVAADPNERWSVVDGVQRMTTINDYMTGKFALGSLEYLTKLNGHKYGDLPRPMQRRIGETQLIVNIIETGTPSEVMFNIFLRINTGGKPLERQEIRNALYPDPARSYLKKLAESEEFLVATSRSIKPKRMADRECVLRFLAFYIWSWEQYDTNDLDGYLGNAMGELNRMAPDARGVITADFKKAMLAAFDILGDDAFRKPRGQNNRRQRINRALFEVWSVQLARCSRSQIALLIERREDVRREFARLIEDNYDFSDSVTYSTGSPWRVHKRFSTIEHLLQGSIECSAASI